MSAKNEQRMRADDGYLVMFSFLLETRAPTSMKRVRSRLAALLGEECRPLQVHPDDAARGLVRLGYRFEGASSDCVLAALERCARVSKSTWAVDPVDLTQGQLSAVTEGKFRTAGVRRADLWIGPLAATDPLPVDSAASSSG
jgi:hypothetical protein